MYRFERLASTVPIKHPVYRFVLEKRLSYRLTTENGKFLITQSEPCRHYKPIVFRYENISVNRTVPKSQPFSVFFAVKDGKRPGFCETVRFALQLKRKTVRAF